MNTSELNQLNKHLEALNNTLLELRTNLDGVNKKIEDFEPSDHIDHDAYVEMLDAEGIIIVCGMEYYPSHILLECDPIAYHCGFNDYCDSIDRNDIQEYCDLQEQLEELEEEEYDLEFRIDELKDQLIDLED